MLNGFFDSCFSCPEACLKRSLTQNNINSSAIRLGLVQKELILRNTSLHSEGALNARSVVKECLCTNTQVLNWT